jgi:hypothetical protein
MVILGAQSGAVASGRLCVASASAVQGGTGVTSAPRRFRPPASALSASALAMREAQE